MKQLLLILITTAAFSLQAQKNNSDYTYLGEYTSNGTPLYLEAQNDVISYATLEMISNSLPESYPVPDFNPHYITSGYETDVVLDAKADVWVTFVSEGAGYKNVLGFYTYDVNNPKTTTPTKEEITIIFPNVSALGSGGGLLTGNKVNIGRFEAGTGIGWVLLANAWSSSESKVNDGLWQLYSNPDFNPESEEALRNHNVLLNDPDNERIILGFEDIRRDYSSCDQDFNDAIFYITASPYQAIRTNNFADISSATDVTSANDGGLESNGDLATKIAARNFKRTQTGAIYNTKKLQSKFNKGAIVAKGNGISIASVLPETGMFGTEIAYVSSPEDLLGITNAKEIFSIDYYQNDQRVSAVFATATENAIYDHSKVICDRLNGAELLDVRTVVVRDHQLISSKIKRATGEIEYTLSFSVRLSDAENELYSYWNIAQYPQGNYFNFQIWGGSFSQVFAIANHIIDTVATSKALTSKKSNEVVPSLFVKSGTYKNGLISLQVINKTAEKEVTLKANIAKTETAERKEIVQTLNLTGNWEEEINLSSGVLFDLGLSLQTKNTTQKDALYLADGPWGTDYLEEFAKLETFDISDDSPAYGNDTYAIERSPTVTGEVKGNINLFRHLLPGDQTLEVSEYESIAFFSTNNLPVEIILMPENLEDWNNRLRFTIPANDTETYYNIDFADFKNANGTSEKISNIKTIVFSMINDYEIFIPFSLAINTLTLNTSAVLSIATSEIEEVANVANYPNPFSENTTIQLPNDTAVVTIKVFDVLGRMIDEQELKASNRKVSYNAPKLNSGIYKYLILDDQSKSYKGSFLIQ